MHGQKEPGTRTKRTGRTVDWNAKRAKEKERQRKAAEKLQKALDKQARAMR